MKKDPALIGICVFIAVLFLFFIPSLGPASIVPVVVAALAGALAYVVRNNMDD